MPDKCIDLENEVRGLFKVFGIKLPPKLGYGAFDEAVRATIKADTALANALLPLLLYRTFRVLDNRTRKLAQQDLICQRLMSAPGVGFVTALTFKAAVANAMMNRSSEWSSLKLWGMHLAKARGHRRAIVAVARKLAVILHRMWLDDTQFRWGTEGTRS